MAQILSPDGRISINIEDHYYDRTDAAVVFKRYDHSNGETRYIYHGNDGTTMPWNDTAQLNYLNPEVREAVIQTILHVARQIPDHPLRRRHDPGETPFSTPVVSRTRDRRGYPFTGRTRHDQGAV